MRANTSKQPDVPLWGPLFLKDLSLLFRTFVVCFQGGWLSGFGFSHPLLSQLVFGLGFLVPPATPLSIEMHP